MAQLIVGISNIACGALLILIALPLLRGKVRRNLFYGVRLPQAFRSEEAWRSINRYGASRLIIWSAALIVFGAVTFLLPLNSPWAIALAAAAPLVVLIPAIDTWRYAQRVDSSQP